MKEIFFITGNKGKVEEAKAFFSDLDIKIVQKDTGYPEIQADSLEEVARFGVDFLSKKIKSPFILEDAGLFIKSLKSFPGVYSAYVYNTLGCRGILTLMKEIKKEERNALFKSVYAYLEPGNAPHFFIGESKGFISFEEKGNNGFGYDPIFVPEGENKSFAEMNPKEKNKYSHRGKSLVKLNNYFKNR